MAQRAKVAAIVSHLMDRAQDSLVSQASGNTVSIQPLEHRDHDAARTLQCLAQLAYSGRSILGNEFRDSRPHPFEVFPQQNYVRARFDHFTTLDQKAENMLCASIQFDVTSWRRIEWFLR